MPHYPSSYYGPGTSSSANNDVTRRLRTKDHVAFSASSRFGGQYIEPKGLAAPYGGMIMDAVAAMQQMVQEINLSQYILPDLGNAVLLSTVGVATNVLANNAGTAVSFIGAVVGTVGTNVFIDNVGLSTGLRVLYYGLTTSALNGVYVVNANNVGGPNTLPNFTLSRASDLTYWWQFVKPKVWLATSGTNNKAVTFALQTDAWEVGSAFQIALGTNLTVLSGTAIAIGASNYTPGLNTSLIYPAYSNAVGFNTGEYQFLSAASISKFTYLKNRARRMAYWIFKLRENYTPLTSSYQNAIPYPIGSGNTARNIGVSTLNDLPSGSRYPSSLNRGW